MIVDLFMVYQFIKRLATPFNEWKAYQLGIIDERGNILKKRKDLTRVEERDAFGIFDVMILKLKRLIEKIPGGKTRIASYAAALYLVKEGKNFDENMSDELLEEQFMKYYTTLNEDALNNKFFEEIVNTSAGGDVAGLPPDEPPVFKRAQGALIRRNKKKKKDNG